MPSYKPSDYHGAALNDYMQWLQKTFGDEVFEYASEKLVEKKMAVNLLETLEPSELAKHCEIEYGLALSIVDCYSEWIETLQVEADD